MTIISAVSEKGGAGKSTFVSNLAAWLASEQGQRVFIFDLDSQAALSAWGERRAASRQNDLLDEHTGDIDVASHERLRDHLKGVSKREALENLQAMVERARSRYDHVLFDVPAGDSTWQHLALVSSEVLVWPMKVGGMSHLTAGNTLGMIRDAQRLQAEHGDGEVAPAYMFFNESYDRSTSARQARGVFGSVDELTLLRTEWYTLKDFAEAVNLGMGVVESNASARAAAQVRELGAELFEAIEATRPAA